jgi:hypothetical protein
VVGRFFLFPAEEEQQAVIFRKLFDLRLCRAYKVKQTRLCYRRVQPLAEGAAFKPTSLVINDRR